MIPQNLNQLYADYGWYNILFNQLNLPSPSTEHAWRKTKLAIHHEAIRILSNSHRKLLVADLGCATVPY